MPEDATDFTAAEPGDVYVVESHSETSETVDMPSGGKLRLTTHSVTVRPAGER